MSSFNIKQKFKFTEMKEEEASQQLASILVISRHIISSIMVSIKPNQTNHIIREVAPLKWRCEFVRTKQTYNFSVSLVRTMSTM